MLFLLVSIKYLLKVIVLDLDLLQVCLYILGVGLVPSELALVTAVEELGIELDERRHMLLGRLVVVLAEALVVDLHVLVNPKQEIRVRSEVHACFLLVAMRVLARLRQGLLWAGECSGCYMNDVLFCRLEF